MSPRPADYFISMAIPGQEERIQGGPVTSAADLANLLAAAMQFLAEHGHSGLLPAWHPFARENSADRDLTPIEEAALTAALEQRHGGRVTYGAPDTAT